MRMRALRLVGAGEPLKLCDVARPRPRVDEVLVRVAGCGVCHTDIGFWREGVTPRAPLPLTLGHEISGSVEAAGAEYESLIGREVIVPAVIACGRCALCVSGRSNACSEQVMPGNDIDGGFAEYVTVPGRGLCVVEERNGYELAELAVVADAVTTPYQAVLRSGLGAGDVAVVVGVGGVGTHCVQIAAAFGAHVVAIDVSESRLAGVRGRGAGLTLDSSALEFRELRRSIADWASAAGCGPQGWKIFECSGSAAGQETAFGLLPRAGVLVVIGFTLAKVSLRLSNLMALDATVQGTWGCRPELYPAALALVTSQRIDLRPFIQIHALADGPDVLRRAADHELDRRAVLVP